MLKGIFEKHIYLLVEKEFAWQFDTIDQWLNENNVELYAIIVGGATAGNLF